MVSGRYRNDLTMLVLVLHQVNQTFHGRPRQGHSLTLDFAEHSSVTLMDPTVIIRRRTFSLVYTTSPRFRKETTIDNIEIVMDDTDDKQQDSC